MKPAAQCCLMGYPAETTKQSKTIIGIKKFDSDLKTNRAVVFLTVKSAICQRDNLEDTAHKSEKIHP